MECVHAIVLINNTLRNRADAEEKKTSKLPAKTRNRRTEKNNRIKKKRNHLFTHYRCNWTKSKH